jgi:uncharacterized membrane protein
MSRFKTVSLYIMAVLYVFAGLNHFVNPGFYNDIMPKYILFPEFMVELSGVAEIALGILLIPKKTREVSAKLIMVMLIVFLIVHVQMLVDYIRNEDKLLWLVIARIPLQFVLIWWAGVFVRNK